MFKQEMYGYCREDVNQYLNETLKRLESFEKTIESQREEIKSLEKRIEILKTSDDSVRVIERAKENADKIIYDALQNINDLENRIYNAIQKELEK